MKNAPTRLMRKGRRTASWLGLAALAGMVTTACDEQPARTVAEDAPSVYGASTVLITAELESEMRGVLDYEDIEQVQAKMRWTTEEDLYNPEAEIGVEVIADGSYDVGALTEALRQHPRGDYEMAAVMVGTRNAILAEEADAALEQFANDYSDLLLELEEREIPAIVCEILPIVAAYDKPNYGLAPEEINQLIERMNRTLYGLALQDAAGIVFTWKTLGPRVHGGAHSIVINETNLNQRNGIQPTPEGMRLVAQMLAYGIHRAGYRGGRVLVLSDSILQNEALTRSSDQIEFLLPKYLEIELFKQCTN